MIFRQILFLFFLNKFPLQRIGCVGLCFFKTESISTMATWQGTTQTSIIAKTDGGDIKSSQTWTCSATKRASQSDIDGTQGWTAEPVYAAVGCFTDPKCNLEKGICVGKAPNGQWYEWGTPDAKYDAKPNQITMTLPDGTQYIDPVGPTRAATVAGEQCSTVSKVGGGEIVVCSSKATVRQCDTMPDASFAGCKTWTSIQYQ